MRRLVAFSLAALACAPAARAPSVMPVAQASPSASETVAPEPRAAPGASPLFDPLRAGTTRPAMHTFHVDLTGVPRAEWSGPEKGARFSIAIEHQEFPTKQAPATTLSVWGSRYTEVTIGGAFEGFTGGLSSRNHFRGQCGDVESAAPAIARWVGFDSFDDTHLVLRAHDGDFDYRTCVGSPHQSLQGAAKALVPGYVYALRVPQPSRDALLFVMPPASFAAVTALPFEQPLLVSSGPFGRVTLPLDAGANAVLVHWGAASMRAWDAVKKGREPVEVRPASESYSFATSFAAAPAPPPEDDLLVEFDATCSRGECDVAISYGLEIANSRSYDRALAAFAAAGAQSSSIGPRSSPESTKNASP